MQMTVGKDSKALEAALARVVHLPPPTSVGDVTRVGCCVVDYGDSYQDYNDAYEDYEDAPDP